MTPTAWRVYARSQDTRLLTISHRRHLRARRERRHHGPHDGTRGGRRSLARIATGAIPIDEALPCEAERRALEAHTSRIIHPTEAREHQGRADGTVKCSTSASRKDGDRRGVISECEAVAELTSLP